MTRIVCTRLHRAYTLFDRLLALGDRVAELMRSARGGSPRRGAALGFEPLEDRLVPDARPLPFPVLFAGDGSGSSIVGIDALTGKQTFEQVVYGPAFTGGVRVAAGDLNDDGYPDAITAPGPAVGPASP